MLAMSPSRTVCSSWMDSRPTPLTTVSLRPPQSGLSTTLTDQSLPRPQSSVLIYHITTGQSFIHFGHHWSVPCSICSIPAHHGYQWSVRHSLCSVPIHHGHHWSDFCPLCLIIVYYVTIKQSSIHYGHHRSVPCPLFSVFIYHITTGQSFVYYGHHWLIPCPICSILAHKGYHSSVPHPSCPSQSPLVSSHTQLLSVSFVFSYRTLGRG